MLVHNNLSKSTRVPVVDVIKFNTSFICHSVLSTVLSILKHSYHKFHTVLIFQQTYSYWIFFQGEKHIILNKISGLY